MAGVRLRSRKWSFTRQLSVPEVVYDPAFHQYLVYQLEACPTTGTHHHQGFFYLHDRTSFTTVQERHPGIHLEVAKGTIEQNIAYCTKEDTRIEPHKEWGTRPSEERHMNGWGWAKEELQKGTSIDEIMVERPQFALRKRALEALQQALRKKEKRTGVTVLWVYGPPGTGKTTEVIKKHEGNVFITNIDLNGNIWFNGYRGESVLVIDEMQSTADSPTLRRVVDHHQFLAPVKLGDPVEAQWTIVYLVSNDHPPEFGAIANRINKVYEKAGESHRAKRVRVSSLDE